MKLNFTLIILSILFLQIFTNNSTHTHKSFLVKTQLTKEQLITLLKEGEANLRIKETENKKEENLTKTEVEEVNNTQFDDAALQEQIEDEIKDDALHPLDEFHVRENPTEVKTFVTKQDKTFIDTLYEKKFGKIYGYLILLLCIFVLIRYKDILFGKGEKIGHTKGNFKNIFESDSSKEYMLIKSE